MSDELNSKQKAIAKGVWKMVENYSQQSRNPINGPDPELDAAEETLKMTIENLVKKAIK